MEQYEIDFYRTLNLYNLSNNNSISHTQQKLDKKINFLFLVLSIILILLLLSFLLVDKN